MQRILISQVYLFQLADYLVIDQPQVVFNCLVQHFMEKLLAHHLGGVRQLPHSVKLNSIVKIVNFGNGF